MIGTKLVDGNGTGNVVRVNQEGELVTGDLEPSVAVSAELDQEDVAFNFFEARADARVRLTGIIINGSNMISINGAKVSIFRADSPTSTTPLANAFQVVVARQSTVPLTGLSIDLPRGVYVNVTTNSQPVNVTLIATLIPVLTGSREADLL